MDGLARIAYVNPKKFGGLYFKSVRNFNINAIC